jgi:hypothetical protein
MQTKFSIDVYLTRVKIEKTTKNTQKTLKFRGGTSKSSIIKTKFSTLIKLKQQTVHRGEAFRSVKHAVYGAIER